MMVPGRYRVRDVSAAMLGPGTGGADPSGMRGGGFQIASSVGAAAGPWFLAMASASPVPPGLARDHDASVACVPPKRMRILPFLEKPPAASNTARRAATACVSLLRRTWA